MQTNKPEPNLIVDLSFGFAREILSYVEQLEISHKYVVANQLIKSGTSIGANIREPQNAESKADFIHKRKIAAKEADETTYWLMLCKEVYGTLGSEELLFKCESISKILSKIISTSKSKTAN